MVKRLLFKACMVGMSAVMAFSGTPLAYADNETPEPASALFEVNDVMMDGAEGTAASADTPDGASSDTSATGGEATSALTGAEGDATASVAALASAGDPVALATGDPAASASGDNPWADYGPLFEDDVIFMVDGRFVGVGKPDANEKGFIGTQVSYRGDAIQPGNPWHTHPKSLGQPGYEEGDIGFVYAAIILTQEDNKQVEQPINFIGRRDGQLCYAVANEEMSDKPFTFIAVAQGQTVVFHYTRIGGDSNYLNVFVHDPDMPNDNIEDDRIKTTIGEETTLDRNGVGAFAEGLQSGIAQINSRNNAFIDYDQNGRDDITGAGMPAYTEFTPSGVHGACVSRSEQFANGSSVKFVLSIPKAMEITDVKISGGGTGTIVGSGNGRWQQVSPSTPQNGELPPSNDLFVVQINNVQVNNTKNATTRDGQSVSALQIDVTTKWRQESNYRVQFQQHYSEWGDINNYAGGIYVGKNGNADHNKVTSYDPNRKWNKSDTYAFPGLYVSSGGFNTKNDYNSFFGKISTAENDPNGGLYDGDNHDHSGYNPTVTMLNRHLDPGSNRAGIGYVANSMYSLGSQWGSTVHRPMALGTVTIESTDVQGNVSTEALTVSDIFSHDNNKIARGVNQKNPATGRIAMPERFSYVLKQGAAAGTVVHITNNFFGDQMTKSGFGWGWTSYALELENVHCNMQVKFTWVPVATEIRQAIFTGGTGYVPGDLKFSLGGTVRPGQRYEYNDGDTKTASGKLAFGYKGAQLQWGYERINNTLGDKEWKWGQVPFTYKNQKEVTATLNELSDVGTYLYLNIKGIPIVLNARYETNYGQIIGRDGKVEHLQWGGIQPVDSLVYDLSQHPCGVVQNGTPYVAGLKFAGWKLELHDGSGKKVGEQAGSDFFWANDLIQPNKISLSYLQGWENMQTIVMVPQFEPVGPYGNQERKVLTDERQKDKSWLPKEHIVHVQEGMKYYFVFDEYLYNDNDDKRLGLYDATYGDGHPDERGAYTVGANMYLARGTYERPVEVKFDDDGGSGELPATIKTWAFRYHLKEPGEGVKDPMLPINGTPLTKEGQVQTGWKVQGNTESKPTWPVNGVITEAIPWNGWTLVPIWANAASFTITNSVSGSGGIADDKFMIDIYLWNADGKAFTGNLTTTDINSATGRPTILSFKGDDQGKPDGKCTVQMTGIQTLTLSAVPEGMKWKVDVPGEPPDPAGYTTLCWVGTGTAPDPIPPLDPQAEPSIMGATNLTVNLVHARKMVTPTGLIVDAAVGVLLLVGVVAAAATTTARRRRMAH